jgi:hypothetical protein
MNKKQTISKIQETRSKYDHNSAIHVNCVRFGKGETLEHALHKFILGWIVVNGGDVRVTWNFRLRSSIKKLVEDCKYLKQWLFHGSEREFLTEAITIDRKEKHDFVILNSGEVIEIVKSSDPPRKGNITRIEI